ncbi:hypothetical protein CLOM_g8419 [Closterium sp. NIES-68]|nr:hypothetical protein CLOM_g8419 [Closterium sp. NIES-68]GJP81009.1 hypothetical protein CLOP_g11193 [Closterium sp. NIES-67]
MSIRTLYLALALSTLVLSLTTAANGASVSMLLSKMRARPLGDLQGTSMTSALLQFVATKEGFTDVTVGTILSPTNQAWGAAVSGYNKTISPPGSSDIILEALQAVAYSGGSPDSLNGASSGAQNVLIRLMKQLSVNVTGITGAIINSNGNTVKSMLNTTIYALNPLNYSSEFFKFMSCMPPGAYGSNNRSVPKGLANDTDAKYDGTQFAYGRIIRTEKLVANAKNQTVNSKSTADTDLNDISVVLFPGTGPLVATDPTPPIGWNNPDSPGNHLSPLKPFALMLLLLISYLVI